MTVVTPDYYSIEELARELDVPIGTLRHWRFIGKGPRAAKVGKYLRYYREDVESWKKEVGVR